MEKRIYNFSAGPAVMPEEVLKEAQENLMALPGVGMSILEISHRSKTFDKILADTKADLKELLGLDDNHALLFLQGGASLQFTMVPINLMPPINKADYIITGSCAKKALKDAKRVGTINIAATTEEGNFKRVPKQQEWTPTTAILKTESSRRESISPTSSSRPHSQGPRGRPCIRRL